MTIEDHALDSGPGLGTRSWHWARSQHWARPWHLAPSWHWARPLAVAALDLVLPPRCLSCRALVTHAGWLCGPCWREIDFMTDPLCSRCGWPFAYDHGAGALCAACAARQPAFGRARAVFRYDGPGRKLILGFKHGDRTEAAPAFGQWLAQAGRGLLADCDLILPVPLHRRRLFARRYNQAALLARDLSRRTAIPAATGMLERGRATPSQAGLSRPQRIRNMRGAFRVRGAARPALKGRHVVVIDDVMTTGATVESCARALRRAGARRVDVLTLARVVRPAHLAI